MAARVVALTCAVNKAFQAPRTTSTTTASGFAGIHRGAKEPNRFLPPPVVHPNIMPVIIDMPSEKYDGIVCMIHAMLAKGQHTDPDKSVLISIKNWSTQKPDMEPGYTVTHKTESMFGAF